MSKVKILSAPVTSNRSTEPVVVLVNGKGEYVCYQYSALSEWIDSLSAPGERLLTHSFLMDTLRKVMGRTLTLIDSSVTDKVQNKAMKDIVRGIISDEMEFASDMGFDQKELQKLMPNNVEDVAEPVTIEEALGVK